MNERRWGEHEENLLLAEQCIKISTWNSCV
jgi:hypothetical protein